MPVRMGWIAAALVLGACAPPTKLFLELEEGMASVVVATERDNALHVEAFDATAMAPLSASFGGEGVAQITVLSYREALDALDMRPGPLVRVLDDAPSQPLPDPDAIHVRTVGGADDGDWIEAQQVPGNVAVFRFARTTPQGCLEGGGCLARPPGGGSLRCVTPCPPPDPPEPPAAPEPPQLTCPEGWTQVGPEGEDDHGYCDPYPATGAPARCSDGDFALPGNTTCEPVGDPCPAGTFAPTLPSDAVYVAPGPAGGDGSRANPFATIAEALPNVPDGGTIALGRGEYGETVTLGRPVSIVGACAEASVIRTPAGAALTVTSSSVLLENVRVIGGTGIAVDGGNVRLDGVDAEGTFSSAMSVERSGSVTGTRVDLSGVGGGLHATGDARVVLDRVTAVDTRSNAVSVDGGAVVTLRDCAIDGTQGGAVYATAGAGARLERCHVGNFAFTAIYTMGGRTSVVLEDVLIRDTSGSGSAIYATEGTTVSATRLVTIGMRGSSISAAGGTVTVTDSVLRRTMSQLATGQYGNAIEASEGGTAHVVRSVLWESRGVGVLSYLADSLVTLEDVVVADTRGWEADGERGNALNAVEGGRIEVDRVKLVRAHGFGIVADLSSSVVGQDLLVLDTMPRDAHGGYGRGAEISDGSTLDVTRAVFDRSRSVAVFGLDPGSRITLRDVRMSNTTESNCIQFSCNAGLADGISVILSAEATVERFEIVGNAQFGVRIANAPLLRLVNGRIADNAVAVQNVSPDFDLSRIAERVLLEDNGEAFNILDQ